MTICSAVTNINNSNNNNKDNNSRCEEWHLTHKNTISNNLPNTLEPVLFGLAL